MAVGMTRAAVPFRPACTMPTAGKLGAVRTTGKQSAVITARGSDGRLVIKPSPGVPRTEWEVTRVGQDNDSIAMYLPECHQIVEIDADCLAESGTVSEDERAPIARPKPQIERGIGRFTAPPKAGAKGMHDHSRLTDGPTRKKGHRMLCVEQKCSHFPL